MLQCIKAVEAAALNPHYTHCENGLVKILMILNLSIVTFMALPNLRKVGYLIGKLFSNIMKIKLFIVDNQSYIPLYLNKIEEKCALI